MSDPQSLCLTPLPPIFLLGETPRCLASGRVHIGGVGRDGVWRGGRAGLGRWPDSGWSWGSPVPQSELAHFLPAEPSQAEAQAHHNNWTDYTEVLWRGGRDTLSEEIGSVLSCVEVDSASGSEPPAFSQRWDHFARCRSMQALVPLSRIKSTVRKWVAILSFVFPAHCS